MAFVLFSAMRNEGPFLLDWIAYHRAIGFEKIVIVTNDCTDGSDALLAKLHQAGIVQHFDQQVPEGVSPQRSAVDLTEAEAVLSDDDWAIFLDADEYLNIKVGQGGIGDLTSYLSDNDKMGMLINWRIFGDSGNPSFAGTYISDAYTGCEEPREITQFKTLFHRGRVARGFSGELHRCRLAPGAGALTDFITGSGAPLGAQGPGMHRRRHSKWLSRGEETYSVLTGAEIGYDIAQINHYAVRDPKSFALKQARGRGHVASNVHRVRHNSDFYENHNRNEHTDDTILRWSAAVAHEKEKITQIGNITEELKEIALAYENAASSSDADAQTETTFALTFPAEETEFVTSVYAKAKSIVEYGSGGSTVLAANLGVPCIAVESDAAWAASLNQTLQDTCDDTPTAVAMHVDIGATKAWGYPRNARSWATFWRYPMQVWQGEDAPEPDVVLIDGRMRKACFAATLMHIKKDTMVLFDDYKQRPGYHAVESLVKPTSFAGRMAVFNLKPGMLQPADVPIVIPWFSDLR